MCQFVMLLFRQLCKALGASAYSGVLSSSLDMKKKKLYLGVINLIVEKTCKTVQMPCILDMPIVLHSLIYLCQSSLCN